MQDTATTSPAFLKAGGHTYKPAWDGGTPNDHSDDVDLVDACRNCHGPVDSFDFARIDYDGDGVVEGVQTEVDGLMDDLAMMLPPLNEPTVEVTADFTPAELKAAFNYTFVMEDGSHGVHNTSYAVGILKAAINDLSGAAPPSGDSDRDGLPDAWEIEVFGSITAQNGQGDADGDGLSNAFEYAAGTSPLNRDSDGDGYSDQGELLTGNDPNNAEDSPELAGHIYTAAEFMFVGQENKTYQVQAITDVEGGAWENVGDPVMGTGDPVQYFFSIVGTKKEFYRVIEIEP
jgi:hypothetical protein